MNDLTPSPPKRRRGGSLHKWKEIYCGVHGYIYLSPMAQRVVDTVEFQRLNWLHQLGASFLVFSSASHTRKSHSFGVYHIARRMAKALQRRHPTIVSDRDIELVGLAALLHDIGHFAFSHVGDEVFKGSASPMKAHEARSIGMLRHMHRKYGWALTQSEVETLCQMIHPDAAHAGQWRFQLVSGYVDADRMDYVVRDSANVGIMTGFGFHHVQHILDHIGIGKHGGLVFDAKVERDVLELLTARSRLHTKVYQHRVSVAIEQMLVEIFRLLEPVYHFEASLDDPEAFVQFHDGVLMMARSNPKVPKEAKALIDRLWTRDFWKVTTSIQENETRLSRAMYGRWVGMGTGDEHPMNCLQFEPAIDRYSAPHRAFWISRIVAK